MRMSLEDAINDDFANMVPPHLRGEGIDVALINELFRAGNSEISEQLYLGMNPPTENAYHKTVDWHLGIERQERYAAARLDIRLQLEEVRATMHAIFPDGIGAAIQNAYATYLINNGLPGKKINWWRKFLLARDANLAQLSGREIDNVEPGGNRLYALIVYPIRKVLRHWMLEGASTYETER